MTNELVKWPASELAGSRGRNGLRSGMAYAVGGLVMLLTLAAGVAVAVIFAATLAVILALATALAALTALAWRVRPRPAAVRAQPVGHAWIAYGWERTPR